MNPKTLHIEGCRRLVAAVIEFAIDDFKMHERSGRIVNGKATSSRTTTRRDGACHSQTEAQKAVHFFTSKTLDGWIEVGCLDIDPDMIRSKLGIGGAK